MYKPVSVPQVKSGQKRQKKCIGAEMSEKTIRKIVTNKKNNKKNNETFFPLHYSVRDFRSFVASNLWGQKSDWNIFEFQKHEIS